LGKFAVIDLGEIVKPEAETSYGKAISLVHVFLLVLIYNILTVGLHTLTRKFPIFKKQYTNEKKEEAESNCEVSEEMQEGVEGKANRIHESIGTYMKKPTNLNNDIEQAATVKGISEKAEKTTSNSERSAGSEKKSTTTKIRDIILKHKKSIKTCSNKILEFFKSHLNEKRTNRTIIPLYSIMTPGAFSISKLAILAQYWLVAVFFNTLFNIPKSGQISCLRLLG